jgi:PAS domain S-box-containing protein
LRNEFAEVEESSSPQEAEIEAVNDRLEREITNRRRMRQRLQELTEQLQEADEVFWTLFENTGAATVVIDENLIILLANRAFEKLSGVRKEKVEEEKNLEEFLTPGAAEKIKEFTLAGRINPNGVLRDYECQFEGSGEKRKDIRLTVAMVPRSAKAVISLLDITDGKKVEERLRELLGSLQDMLAGLDKTLLILNRE